MFSRREKIATRPGVFVVAGVTQQFIFAQQYKTCKSSSVRRGLRWPRQTIVKFRLKWPINCESYGAFPANLRKKTFCNSFFLNLPHREQLYKIVKIVQNWPPSGISANFGKY